MHLPIVDKTPVIPQENPSFLHITTTPTILPLPTYIYLLLPITICCYLLVYITHLMCNTAAQASFLRLFPHLSLPYVLVTDNMTLICLLLDYIICGITTAHFHRVSHSEIDCRLSSNCIRETYLVSFPGSCSAQCSSIIALLIDILP